MRFAVLAFIATMIPMTALAAGFEVVREKSAFLTLVKNKDLRIGLYNLTLKITPDGRIRGSALGWGITGSWAWKDGYFCREMDWSGTLIKQNCQLVEARGTDTLRFTVDQGKGNSASFRLR